MTDPNYAKGHEEGHESGLKSGLEIGRDEGYKKGHKAGFDEAFEMGKQQGIAIGLKRATKRGPHKEPTDDYRRGYIAGYEAGKAKIIRDIENPDSRPRPEKYAFHTLKVDDTKIVGEKISRKVYHAGRAWARRNAPTRKFSVRPTTAGTTITRTA